MANKWEVEIDGQKYELEGGDNPPSEQEARLAISEFSGIPQNIPKPSLLERFTEPLPEIGQFGGGIVGGMFGSPYLGSAAGGTAGRLGGKLAQMRLRTQPVETALEFSGLLPRQFVPTPEEMKTLLPEFGVTAPIELATAGLAKGAVGAGRGIMKTIVGQKAAEFGQKYGWKPILELADRISRKVPTPVKEKMGGFFRNISNKVGGQLDNLIREKYSNVTHTTSGLRANMMKWFPKGKSIKDLEASKIQKTKIENFITDKLFKKTKMSLYEIWNARRELDDLLFQGRWTDEAYDFLNHSRQVLNAPMKQYDDVAGLFTKYSGVKDAEKRLGKYMTVHKGLEKGEVFSPEIESFGKKVMGVTGDELIEWLQSLDKVLGPEFKVTDDFFKYAASQALEGEVGWSYITKAMLGALGGRKLLPRIGEVIQRPSTQVMTKGFGRFIPTAITEGLMEE